MTVEVVSEDNPPGLAASCDRSKERQIALMQQLRLVDDEATSAGKEYTKRGPGCSFDCGRI